MARYTGSVSKVSRRLGVAIAPKAEKFLERRPYAPGQHGQNKKSKISEYAVQLREKQKMKYIYGVLERQFRTYYAKASAMRGVTGDNLVKMLESRLDNVVYRSGFAVSRRAARQLVSHCHLLVNGKKTNIPSYQLRSGDVIEFRQKSKNMDAVRSALNKKPDSQIPQWIQVDKANLKAIFVNAPERSDVQEPFNEQLVVELYSK
ncbi:MAG: 30S ribosomal protein S4 [[Candidatus Thermochlorobacteriaceae] bacterium GBChlB]|nr:MAG: 30S ribosomal protein S4 [[Candidatus Thermochlorobacteriaceae] bacterium GBChlB]